jgi:cellulase (glycosyl hydrolase family 5)
MNLARVPFYWEGYVNDPTAFLNEVELVAQEAKANNICVIFDNHHWYTTSYWNIEIAGNSDGRGFPSFVVKNFPVRNNDYEDTAKPFWTAFLSNDISINGRSVWDMQAEFFAKVISRADNYKSVVGYEILNEPHLFDSSQYEMLGDYHTYMAKKIRTMTDKKIFFDRETARGFPREPSSEYKIVPRGVSGVVYGPHLYSAPIPGSQAADQLDNFAQWAKEWDMDILVGEWSADTASETDTYLKAFKDNGFGWTYYAWKPTQSRGGGNSLYDSPTVDPTEALRQLKYSINKTYSWS